MPSLVLYNREGEQVGEIEVQAALFAAPMNKEPFIKPSYHRRPVKGKVLLRSVIVAKSGVGVTSHGPKRGPGAPGMAVPARPYGSVEALSLGLSPVITVLACLKKCAARRCALR